MENLVTWYYRGAIDFCNYQCGYCPFAKGKVSPELLLQDERSLARFVSAMQQREQEKKDVFLLPYGESLLYVHTMRALAKLAKLEQVRFAAIQTNLSLDLQQLARVFAEADAKLEKLLLWCSFHPSQTSVDSFLAQCRTLAAMRIPFSVGAVAVPENMGTISRLRQALPRTTYLWLNAQDGRCQPYTREEIQDFTWIDPFFSLELSQPKADLQKCDGGRSSFFVEENGDIAPCNIARTRQGNLYAAKEYREATCRSRSCSCFLAYAQRKLDMMEDFFGDTGKLRLPKRHSQPIYSFDIDGTLLDFGAARVEPEIAQRLEKLAEKGLLFFNTARRYAGCHSQIKQLLPCFEGGSFNNGGDIRCFQKAFHHTWAMDKAYINALPEPKFVAVEKGEPVRAMFKGFRPAIDAARYQIFTDEDSLYLVHKYAGKENALAFLSRLYRVEYDQILHIGDGQNDVMQKIPYRLVHDREHLLQLIDVLCQRT